MMSYFMPHLRTRLYSPEHAQNLAAEGIHPVLARLYASRGVLHKQEVSHQLDALIHPKGLLNNEKAAQCLADAIEAQKTITVIADYDCDGATACAVAVRGLRQMGAIVNYVVPNRFQYGYGLSPEIVALADEQHNPDIILTVDNGIASLEGVAEARQRRIDVLITDHHLPGATLPQDCIIVNPNQPDCSFPSKHLAGVGVMFYVLLALRSELRQRQSWKNVAQPNLAELLDLVALGTVADVVALDSNNRTFVAQGLKRIRQGRLQPGIAALFNVAGKDPRRATSFDLGFAIGPRLNAAGRLEDMSLGIECLLSDDPHHAATLAEQLHSLNQERRAIEADMQSMAQWKLEQTPPSHQTTLCLYDESWHAGVIGIVASRLKEQFYRPTITFAPAEEEGWIKGSGRSIPGFHLRDALDRIAKHSPSLLSKFGGHAMAAGLTLRLDAFDAFQHAFEAVGQALLSPEQLQAIIETDGSLSAHEIHLDLAEHLEQEIWGQGFPPPCFYDSFQVIQQRILKDKHLKLWLEKEGQRYEAIWFGHATPLPQSINVAYRLDINHYNGNKTVQLIIQEAVEH
jgi:single-stranded-DNA-specific exonuclease